MNQEENDDSFSINDLSNIKITDEKQEKEDKEDLIEEIVRDFDNKKVSYYENMELDDSNNGNYFPIKKKSFVVDDSMRSNYNENNHFNKEYSISQSDSLVTEDIGSISINKDKIFINEFKRKRKSNEYKKYEIIMTNIPKKFKKDFEFMKKIEEAFPDIKFLTFHDDCYKPGFIIARLINQIDIINKIYANFETIKLNYNDYSISIFKDERNNLITPKLIFSYKVRYVKENSINLID